MEHYASIFIDEFFMAFFNSLTRFTHEVGNEKEEILRSQPYIIAVSSKNRHTIAASCK